MIREWLEEFDRRQRRAMLTKRLAAGMDNAAGEYGESPIRWRYTPLETGRWPKGAIIGRIPIGVLRYAEWDAEACFKYYTRSLEDFTRDTTILQQTIEQANNNLKDFITQIDYATLEQKVANALGINFKEGTMSQTREEQEAELKAWREGKNPFLKVRLWQHEGRAKAMYGVAITDVGLDSKMLESIGYRFEIDYMRVYFNPQTEQFMLLRPNEVPYKIPMVLYLYKGSRHDPEVEPGLHLRAEGDNQYLEPLSTGGEVRVRIFAPSGHWAEGIARCADDDTFIRDQGRNIALGRAVEALNARVHGE